MLEELELTEEQVEYEAELPIAEYTDKEGTSNNRVEDTEEECERYSDEFLEDKYCKMELGCKCWDCKQGHNFYN